MIESIFATLIANAIWDGIKQQPKEQTPIQIIEEKVQGIKWQWQNKSKED